MIGIPGVLLAAGSSRRFGGDKRLHVLPGQQHPMVIACALQLGAQCAETLVVLRHDDGLLAGQLDELGIRSLRCAAAVNGMGNSLAAGVAAFPGAAGWLVALADMPGIAPESYDVVLRTVAEGADVARPRYQGRPGHPVCFGRHWFHRLTTLSGDEGARGLLGEAGAEVVCCDVDDPCVCHDIDTKHDLLHRHIAAAGAVARRAR